MKRKTLLAISGCDDRRFETLMQREQTPFPSKGRWADYSLAEAFELKLTIDLIGGAGGLHEVGIAPAHASNIISSALATGRGKGFAHPLNAGADDLWVGVAIVEDGTSVDRLCFTKWFFGTASDMPDFIAEANSVESDEVVKLFVVNASKAARFVRNKAVELEIEEAHDFSEEWPQ